MWLEIGVSVGWWEQRSLLILLILRMIFLQLLLKKSRVLCLMGFRVFIQKRDEYQIALCGRRGGRLAGKLMKKILFASNKHDGLFKSLRTFACATENILPLHRNKPELKRICRSDEIRWLLNTNETCLCSVLYARWGMFLMCVGFSHLPPVALNNNTQY